MSSYITQFMCLAHTVVCASCTSGAFVYVQDCIEYSILFKAQYLFISNTYFPLSHQDVVKEKKTETFVKFPPVLHMALSNISP